MMDDATLAYLEKNKDEANPSYWIPKLIAEIRRLRPEPILLPDGCVREEAPPLSVCNGTCPHCP